MADMLSIGSSALLAYQRALATVSNNVANANTPGYERRQVKFQSVASSSSGGGMSGAGVNAVSVTRVHDDFATSQLWNATASSASASSMAAAATQVDNQLSSANLTLATPTGKLFDAFGAWASNPTDSAARQAVLQSAQTLASRWNATDQQLGNISSSLVQQAGGAIDQINTLTRQIAKYNNAITVATGNNGGNPPNDLLDKRDQAVASLAAQIGISVVTDNSGTMNVFTDGGQPLVVGTHATRASLTRATNTGALQLQLGQGTSAVRLANASGGALGGTLSALQGTVIPARRQLTAVANQLAQAVNVVQTAGTDMNGNPGQPLFSVASPTTLAAAANTGGATLSAQMKNAINWPAEPVQFKYDGSQWTAVGVVTGKHYPALGPISGTGTAADPLSAAGLSVTVNGTPQAGDAFTVDATRSDLAVNLSNPAQLAAANPVAVTPADTNTGSAVVNRLQVTDPTNTALRTPVTLQFSSPTQVSINGAPPVDYNGTVAANGWSLNLSGTPDAGDSFTVSPTGANSANNGIANLLAGLRTQAGAGSDGQSITQAQNALIASVGSQTARAQGLQQAQDSLLSNAQSSVDSISGVSLDQEAADLVRYQQAYQAAAQVMSSAQTLFNSLLRAASGA